MRWEVNFRWLCNFVWEHYSKTLPHTEFKLHIFPSATVTRFQKPRVWMVKPGCVPVNVVKEHKMLDKLQARIRALHLSCYCGLNYTIYIMCKS